VLTPAHAALEIDELDEIEALLEVTVRRAMMFGITAPSGTKKSHWRACAFGWL
jgi:hypothetical protein